MGGVTNPIAVDYSSQTAITDSADGNEKVLSQEATKIEGISAITYHVSSKIGFEEATIVLITSKKLEIIYYNKPFQQYQDVFTQILSTFKFTEATGSASPTPASKACTLEAKVCPDGSSVGRSGPNCEFAPCP